MLKPNLLLTSEYEVKNIKERNSKVHRIAHILSVKGQLKLKM